MKTDFLKRSWVRVPLVSVLCLLAGALVVDHLLTPKPFSGPATFDLSRYQQPDFAGVVERVDATFRDEWKHRGLSPAPVANGLAVARRLSLALTGTIPSFEEVRAVEAEDPERRTQWWLTYLFEDRRHADYLAERFSRMLVGVENGPFIVYRRHRLSSWLSDQILDNRPYDDLVRALITSEGIWTTHPEVNFVTATVDQNNDEEGPDEVKLAGRTARAFLGVRLDCVECHDDFLSDRWTQQDFHRLAAFYSRAEMSLTGVRDDPDREYDYRFLGKRESETVSPAVPFRPELLPADGSRRDRLAGWVTHPDNRSFARATVNRMWAILFNRPLILPIDDIPVGGPVPPAMDVLAADFVRNGYDLRRLIRVIAATEVFRLDSTQPETRAEAGDPDSVPGPETVFASFPLTRLRPDQVAGSILQASSLRTIDADSHVLKRIIRLIQRNDFLKRYGDVGEDEFSETAGTIPQRLVLMNGSIVHERIKDNLVLNAATRIAALARDPERAVEVAYLTVLTRRPTVEESAHFVRRMLESSGQKRSHFMEDLFWILFNSTEFSWNH